MGSVSASPVVMGGGSKVGTATSFLKCFLTVKVFMELQSENTGVGFGRTDLSFRANGTIVCALLDGHGSVDIGFQKARQQLDIHY